MNNKDWPLAFVLATLIVSVTILVSSCIKREHEGNLELMRQGTYGLTAQEASEVVQKKHEQATSDK